MPPKRLNQLVPRPHTYESQGGSHVTLEFADPTASPMVSPIAEYKSMILPVAGEPVSSARLSAPTTGRASAPMLSRATSWSGVLRRDNSTGRPTPTPKTSSGSTGPGQTRLQGTFQAIKRLSAGLSSPRVDPGPGRVGDERNLGYFVATTEE